MLKLSRMQLFGIPNCNTVKKARAWLEARDIAYTFHDFKKEPPTQMLLENWLTQQPWSTLVNRAGMTWRNLTDAEKAAVNDHASAIHLMVAKPSVIKRPVLIKDNQILSLGFAESNYEAIFSS